MSRKQERGKWPDPPIGPLGPKAGKSGFENDDQEKICLHPQHEPPMHLYIPHGKRYRHVCPGCGRELVIRGSGITF
jgi:hypothetical protein